MGLLVFASVAGAAQKQKTTILHLKILHYRAPCWEEAVRLCYLVEKKDGQTENFYSSIEGFHYEWGYNYELLVEKFTIAAPKADGSSLGYRLKKQVSKVKVAPGLRFELPLIENGYRMVRADDKKCLYLGTIPIHTGSFSCEELKNAKIGVFQHAPGGLQLTDMK